MSAIIVSKLSALFDANRTARRLQDELVEQAPAELLEVLSKALDEVDEEGDEDEASLRQIAIAGLLAELDGPRAVDLLIDVLDSDLPDVRFFAGERLDELAYERFKEVARGVERALQRLPVGSPALAELPHLLGPVPEPGVNKLLAQFLKHEDPEAVASAVQALVEAGDPSAIELIKPLLGDTRLVDAGDSDNPDDEEGQMTLDELVQDALELLGESEDE